MTEITQADRDAAAAHSKHWGRHAQAANVKRGSADSTFLLKLLARHREQAEQETVAKIVAWLRDEARGPYFADLIKTKWGKQ